jgi:aryl carrier-like protein
MTADECHERAAECAAKAALAPTELDSIEFLSLAAQWRAMAARETFPGHLDEPGHSDGVRGRIPAA